MNKQLIKEATQEEHRLFNEGLLDSLHDTDSSGFWRLFRKRWCSQQCTQWKNMVIATIYQTLPTFI